MENNSNSKQFVAGNKHAKFNYELLDFFTAGIVLKGSEIKAIRAGKINITDTYCAVTDGEMWLYNSHIGQYRDGTCYNHEEDCPRKLLLHKSEINKLSEKSKIKGYTIVPVDAYIENGLCKLTIALAKGKSNYDKRETIKERDDKREMERVMKNF